METEFSISIDGILVFGKIIHRNSRNIVVEIKEPYKGISRGLHIPYFAPPNHNYEGDHGRETAEKLLKQIYTICQDAVKNAPQLKEGVNNWDMLRNEYQEKIISNKEHKQALKKELKSGVITQTQYQSTLKAMDEELSKDNFALREVFEETIQPFFSEIIGVGDEEGVVNFVRVLD